MTCPNVARPAAIAALSMASCLALGLGLANADDALIKSGAYVTNAAGCAACHNSPDGTPFAGGLVLKTPFGPMATPNITSDKQTGIGEWTFEDFQNALHKGINKDGDPLYPAMPYVHYTLMTDDDLKAIWAYIQTIAPVNNTVDVNQLAFPFDVRASLYVWRARYFTDERFQPDSSESDEWNRGAYIIKALAHCGACHTPRDALGGSITSRALQGAQVEEWYAPDISNGPRSVIRDWDVERLASFLSGESENNHVALGSMQRVVDDLGRMHPDDVKAVAVYLKNQPETDTEPPAPRGVAADQATRERWADVYAANCVSCHGTNGEGLDGVAASLVGAGGVIAAEPDNIISVLLEGVAPRGDYGLMPSFRTVLSDEEIAGVANHVRTSWGNDAPANATPAMVVTLRNMTEAAPGTTAAATCPAVAADMSNEAIRKEVTGMAGMSSLDNEAMGRLAKAYKEAFPDATLTDTITNLGGLFCRDVLATGASKGTVVSRQLSFMNALVDIDSRQ